MGYRDFRHCTPLKVCNVPCLPLIHIRQRNVKKSMKIFRRIHLMISRQDGEWPKSRALEREDAKCNVSRYRSWNRKYICDAVAASLKNQMTSYFRSGWSDLNEILFWRSCDVLLLLIQYDTLQIIMWPKSKPEIQN